MRSQEPGEVATVVERLARRVEAGDQAVAGQAAPVVGGVPVLEAVGHDEVEVLVGDRPAQRVLWSQTVLRVRRGLRSGRWGDEPGAERGRQKSCDPDTN